MSSHPAPSGHHLPRGFHFVRHLAVYGTVSALALAAEALSGADWPLFWPLAGWAALLAMHYFVASSYDLDGTWVDERISDIRSRSYDFDHIRSIEQRVKDRDASVTPATERDNDGEAP